MTFRISLDHAAFHVQQSLQLLHLWEATIHSEDVGKSFAEIIEARIRALHALQARDAAYVYARDSAIANVAADNPDNLSARVVQLAGNTWDPSIWAPRPKT